MTWKPLHSVRSGSLFSKYEKRTGPSVQRAVHHARMITYAQFCPVAKAAEVFGDRWSPIIIRELCFGTRSFGELLDAAPLISRTVLAQRLKELAQAGVIYIDAKPQGRGHLYRLTPAGEDFRPIVELLSVWGQRWGQGLIGPDDLDPGNARLGNAQADRSGGDTRERVRRSFRFSRHPEILSQPALLVARVAARGYRGVPQTSGPGCRRRYSG